MTKVEIPARTKLPNLFFPAWKVNVRVKGDRIVVEGDLTDEEVEELKERPQEALKKLLPLDLAIPIAVKIVTAELREAYRDVHEELPGVLDSCYVRVDVKSRRITIDARHLPYNAAARLVGKNGEAVSRVERRLGYHIDILGPR